MTTPTRSEAEHDKITNPPAPVSERTMAQLAARDPWNPENQR